MTPHDRLVALGYLIARNQLRGWGGPQPLDPRAFPFDAMRFWGLSPDMDQGQLGTVVAAFAHYVQVEGQVSMARQLQMQKIAQEIDEKSGA